MKTNLGNMVLEYEQPIISTLALESEQMLAMSSQLDDMREIEEGTWLD